MTMLRIENKKKSSHISQGNSYSLIHQFNSLDLGANNEVQSVINTPFDTFGFSQNTEDSGLKFPDSKDEGNEFHNNQKFNWKSNPIPHNFDDNFLSGFNSNPGVAYSYYNSNYSPFDQFDAQVYQPQNTGHYNPDYDNFGSVHYQDPFSAKCQEGIQFPDSDPAGMYNSGNNIFTAFDRQENSNPFGSVKENDWIQFPSGSNMVSTSNTSNYMRQFHAYNQFEYQQTNRISWPIQLRSKSELDYKQPTQVPKFRSGDASKSMFMKMLETRLDELNDAVAISEILGQGKLVEVAMNQKGSRYLQEVYYSLTDEEKQQIFDEIKESWKDLMADKFGNYVIQKIFEHGPEIQKEYFAKQIKGSVMSLSIDDHGCRVIQKLLENLKSSTRLELIKEFEGNVEKLIYNRNGNHVLQKWIEFVPESYLNFIIEEITENHYAFCKHKYGCRVIGKLIEFWKGDEADRLVDEILPNINELTFDASGNYVSQSIIMHGKTMHK